METESVHKEMAQTNYLKSVAFYNFFFLKVEIKTVKKKLKNNNNKK